MRRSVARIEFNGSAVFIFSASPVPFIKDFDKAERGVSFRERIVYVQSLLSRAASFRHRFVWRKMRGRKRVVNVCEASVSERVFWINGNRLLKIFYGVVESVLRHLAHAEAALKIEAIRFRVVGVAFAQQLLLFA